VVVCKWSVSRSSQFSAGYSVRRRMTWFQDLSLNWSTVPGNLPACPVAVPDYLRVNTTNLFSSVTQFIKGTRLCFLSVAFRVRLDYQFLKSDVQ